MIAEGKNKPLFERVRETVRYVQMQSARRRLLPATAERPSSAAAAPRSFIILAGDTDSPTGSRGDEAMIQAIIDRVRDAQPDAAIAITTRGGGLPDALRAQSVAEAPIWGDPWKLGGVWQKVQGYDGAIVVGADVMDGYYSSVTSLRLWMLGELFAATKGAGRAVIGGFSMNSHVTWPVRRFLSAAVSPNLAINVRDPISHRRFAAIARPSARLVADLAFMLQPRAGAAIEPAEAWVAGRRADGRIICGLNIHPMLSPSRDPVVLDALVRSFAAAGRTLIDQHGCSLILIPHDYRASQHGDVGLLSDLAAAIDRPGDVMLQHEPTSAAEIKRLTSVLDCVFTGRMHLSIAALGTGCPVVGITYQDKFDGLFLDHFGLDPAYLVKADAARDEAVLTQALIRCVQQRDVLRAHITARLPQVTALSRDNLAPLLEQAHGG